MRKLGIKLFVIMFLMFSTIWVVAQPLCIDNPYDPTCVDEEDPYNIPIDGGVSALLVGGVLIGYKALKKKRTDDSKH